MLDVLEQTDVLRKYLSNSLEPYHPSVKRFSQRVLRTNASHNLSRSMGYLSGLHQTTISGALSDIPLPGAAIKGVQSAPLLHRINKSAFPTPKGLYRNIKDQDVILLEDVCQLDWIGAGKFAASGTSSPNFKSAFSQR